MGRQNFRRVKTETKIKLESQNRMCGSLLTSTLTYQELRNHYFWFQYLCVCVCFGYLLCRCVHACGTHGYTCVEEPGLTVCVFSHLLSTFKFWDIAIQLDQLSTELQGSVCPYLTLSRLQESSGFLNDFWGSEVRSSDLQSKYFTD